MDELATIEQAKYTRMWNTPEYRRFSPGEREMERAFRELGAAEGHSLIDYGAGPGRATEWFMSRGVRVTAVDIAPNALEVDVPFVHACLWDLPETLGPSDLAYCCDVMEHIPEHQVGAVFAGIAERTVQRAYFRIATRNDVMGPRYLGEPLHLTVQDASWWLFTARHFWDKVELVYSDPRDVIFHASAR